ncbi:MAG: hypothetical protein M1817_005764 [Caeruleum heppii]|nr:MAG: hypothetical protein M1817_005764 [Caeruleum heppii]
MPYREHDGYHDDDVVATRHRHVVHRTDISPRPRPRPRERPNELSQPFYNERRLTSRETHSAGGSPARRSDEGVRRSSRSVGPSSSRRRHNQDDRLGYRDPGTDSDSSSGSDSSGRRHSRKNKRHSTRKESEAINCKCKDHKPAHGSDDDDDLNTDYSSSDEIQTQKQMRKKEALAAGLACVTTLAVTNGVYQATKAHKTRRKQMTESEGNVCSAEAARLKEEHHKRNMIALGIAAVGLYNCRNGWRRMLTQRDEYHEAIEKHQKKREKRDRGDKFDRPYDRTYDHPRGRGHHTPIIYHEPKMIKHGHEDASLFDW